ncbi:hypothetical protein sos41_19570 [Alphaproteobacteria bacterium SO-S41]|nr:hypothetical protein sos41_19570 [Alphaproteobacteria bacterium SO-S41]
MSLLKRLFGGGEKTAAPATPAAEVPADPRAEVQKARDAARVIRRQREPLKWAEAQQLLANALIQYAAVQTGGSAVSSLEEAESCLYDATDAAGPDANPGFLASMYNLWGYAAYRRAARLDGDAKGQALADAANRFTDALDKITPETQRALWIDIGFYRGAAYQELALLKGDAGGAPWLDEAAAAFRAVAERGTEDGSVHPIAAYNMSVVLRDRARLATGGVKRATLQDARRWLAIAAESSVFPNPDQLRQQLVALDSEIAAIS